MDISQVSFKISGSAGNASKSLSTLITRLGQLDTAFVKAVGSGNATIAMLNGVAGALGAGVAQASAYNGAISGLSVSLKGLSNTSKAVKLPTAKISQHTTATKSATVATKKQDTEIKKLNKSLMMMGTNSHHAMGSLGRLVRTLSQLAFVTILTRQVFTGLITGFKSAIGYMENLNLFMVALGENTTRATGFIKEMSESFYLDEAQLTRTQGLFYQISESLGLASEKAYTLSTNFTKLAYDLASFYNISVSDAVTKLQAGLVGETEPLRRIGIIITENNLAETARNLGIRKSIRNMTEQEKIQLRYVTALQQTQNAQTDLARTMTQPENLLRIFNEQWQVLIRNLGSSFIPMLQKVMPHIIGITKALADMAEQYAKIRGYVAPMVRDDLGGYSKVVANESEKQAKSTTKTAKELSKILKYTRDISSATTGIDELNILGEQGGTAFDIGNLFETDDTASQALNIPLPNYDNAMNKAKGTFDAFVEYYRDKIAEIWEIFTQSSAYISFGELKETLSTLFDGVKVDVWYIINEVVTGILTSLKDMIEFGKTLYNDAFKPIMELLAPDWMKSMMDGTEGNLAKTVAFLTKAFVAWKIIKFSVGFIGGLTKLITLGGLIGGPTGLLALFTAMTAVQLAFDFKEAKTTGDFTELKKKIKDGLLAGLIGAGLTGSWTGAMLAINISVLFNAQIEDAKVALGTGMFILLEELIIKPIELIVNFIIDRLNDIMRLINLLLPKSMEGAMIPHLDIPSIFNTIPAVTLEDMPAPKKENAPVIPSDVLANTEQFQKLITAVDGVKEAIITNSDELTITITDTNVEDAPLTIQNAVALYPHLQKLMKSTPYANGGKPTKGELFIAGEKGPELVTEHNGQTVVMNEKQLAERGVSFYANGTNVPKWTQEEILKAKFAKNYGKVPTWKESEIQSAGEYNAPQTWNVLKEAMVSVAKTTKDIYKKAKDSIFGKVFTATISGLGKAIPALYGVYKTDPVTFSERSLAGGPTADQKSMALGAMAQIPYLGQVIGVLDAIESGAVLDFFTNLPNFIEAGMQGFSELLDGVIEALPAILEQIPIIITKIAELFSNKDTINKMIQSAILIVMAIVEALPTIIQSLVTAIPNIITTLIGAIIENIPKFLKLGIAIGLAIIDGLVNIITGGINWLIDQLNKIPFVNIKHIPPLNLAGQFAKSAFADGGFPMQGQMFIAREAGAELVGNIGGRTAVMNNDQIVESVSRGVYEAMISAQQSNRSAVVVNLDGRKISNNQRRVSRTMGLDFGLGGF